MAGRRSDARARLISATQNEVRRRGYTATRVEDICASAGVTKGSFFHHFASKDALGVTALRAWSQNNEQFFAEAPYQAEADAVLRLIGYVDFRIAMIGGDVSDYSCFAGTIVQELHATNDAVAGAGSDDLVAHNERMAGYVRDAQIAAGLDGGFDADGLAQHMQAVTQGAFILAKGSGGADAARPALTNLKTYLEFLFAAHLAALREAARPGGDPK